ncbi:ComEC/Rec2 family competence protein [Aeromicrobium fastidiosum]|uniref:ComEC/Rec2 family competence protein n=1 Tax=Aeromicrobium fastidiosum TaxID=52699 RepID=UPI0020233F6C|nr:ComEC/Rec2 family competence protein [Aeromicrobium fastidiosum]MCL8252614.1 ComEC/Rec2 family competence protein [Aeromicrobium fastidiosum]
MTHDGRMVPGAAASWCLAAWLVTSGSLTAAVVGTAAVVVAAASWRRRVVPLALAAVCVAAVAVSCSWRLAAVEHSPLVGLARSGQLATLEVQVSSDARTIQRRGVASTVVGVVVRRVAAGDLDLRVREAATAFVDGRPDDLVVGRRLVVQGRLAPSDRSDESVTIRVGRIGPATGAAWWWEASEHVREGVRRSVSHLSDEPRGLVPALVDGDEGGITDDVDDDFRRSGLTHLTAVSGTNLTIVLGVTMAVARAGGLGRRGLWVVGLLSIAAFVLLARPEPSVVRAAAMGAVGVAALGLGSRGGLRALCWAVVGLLFVDPWLSRSPGFVLSVSATAGILVLAPVFARRLEAWMPRWCALAIGVPLAAQLVCTPALAALSGEVSLVAVFANLLAAPAVAPATVAGLVGGLLALVWAPLGQVCGTAAGACASWILTVGHTAAGLDASSFEWHAPWQVLLVVVPAATWVAVRLASRPVLFVGLVLGLAVGIWRPPETGWPPPGWVMVSCDVGQGDATVLPVGPGQAVVVDVGEDDAPVDRCLTSLGVRTVRLLVLTHGDADHVDGWRGAVEGRRVDQVVVGTSGGPPIRGVPRHVAEAGESFTLGETSAEVLWPPADEPPAGDRNGVSVVLRATVRGVRLLLTGDVGAEAQQRILRSGADVAADVLKVAHHGSADQEPRFVAAAHARIATISVGEHNDYGHPTAALLAMLRDDGTAWWRTDRDGDVAVVVRDGRMSVVGRG